MASSRTGGLCSECQAPAGVPHADTCPRLPSKPDGSSKPYVDTTSSKPEGWVEHEHVWYVGDSDTEQMWHYCRALGFQTREHELPGFPRAAVAVCKAQKVTATYERHLNNAIAACYADAGPSAALTDIRAAMELLGIEETTPQPAWNHWFSRGETEWENPY